MPGDVVLGKMGVVIFIPPHLAERVVKNSEFSRLEDMFGHHPYTGRKIYCRAN